MYSYIDKEGNRHRTKESRDAFNTRLAARAKRETLRAKLDRIEEKLNRLLRLNDHS